MGAGIGAIKKHPERCLFTWYLAERVTVDDEFYDIPRRPTKSVTTQFPVNNIIS